MPQTLLAVAASILLAVYGLSRHQALAADERASIGREVESAAGHVAERWAALARDLAFDESDVGQTQVRFRGNVAGLSARLGVDAGERLSDVTTLDDADDLHGLDATEMAVVGDGVVPLRVRITATYATGGATPTASPTTAKVITVVVAEVTSGPTRRPPVQVTLPVRVTSTLRGVRAAVSS